jgi:hypothetical protein
MPKTKIDIVKAVVGAVAGYGASRIAKMVIEKNTDDEERLHNRAAVFSAEVVIGMAVSDVTRRYTDAKVDEAVDWWNENIKPRL